MSVVNGASIYTTESSLYDSWSVHKETQSHVSHLARRMYNPAMARPGGIQGIKMHQIPFKTSSDLNQSFMGRWDTVWEHLIVPTATPTPPPKTAYRPKCRVFGMPPPPHYSW